MEVLFSRGLSDGVGDKGVWNRQGMGYGNRNGNGKDDSAALTAQH